MNIGDNARQAAGTLGYQFKSDTRLIEALTTPGVEGEGSQGNRWLGDFGIDVIRSCLSFYAYESKIRPNQFASTKQKLCSYNHLMSVAQRTNLDRVIIYNPRSGKGRPIVVGKALAAIIAAAHLDCGRSYQTTWKILEYIGFFDPERNGVDPAQLESRVDDNPCLSITSPPMGNNREISQTTGSPVGLEWSTARSISELENTAAPSVSPGFEGVETENDVQIVRQENQKRKALAPSPLEDKNGLTKAKQVRRSTHDQVAAYLVREAIKCKAQNLQTPQESYFTVEVESRLLKACNNRSVEVAKKLLLCIGSSQSILSLQDAIQSWRTGTDIRFLQMSHCSSKADTFDIISKMSQVIACLYLFRRYHIVRLFEKCGGCETPSVSRFVAVAVNNSAVLKRPGNPLKNAETELNVAMMKEVLPHLKPGTSEYEEEYNSVNNLRLLARRYSTLQNRFGPGILALIPNPDQSRHTGLGISESSLLRVPESVFLEIVSILERSQGHILGAFSTAAWRIMETLLYQPAQHCSQFQLERTDTRYILEQPKNSSSLLYLLK
ncbi:hypothetical protein BDV34DRAFT_206706 [Aspergillus parasiticus]|uniref:RNase III domain-containing protein n=1 Tax=Aspergillus parasiticus TaxID=5067 RepID=A0A5N6D2M1_ASPPA|nr:hypothetical protein BDV34DRAFT_206706 [Aspergillus parasiticus]